MSKNLIDKLVEQMLSEKRWKEPPADIKTAGDFSFYKKDITSFNPNIDTLKAFDDPKDTLNDKDLDYLITNPAEITFDQVKAVASIIKKYRDSLNNRLYKDKYSLQKLQAKKPSKPTQDKIVNINKEINYLQDRIAKYKSVLDARDKYIEDTRGSDPGTITAPEISSRQGDYQGGFSSDQIAVIDRAMASTAIGAGRFKVISKISQRFYDAAGNDQNAINELNALPKSELMNQIMLIDIFNQMAKETDAASSAYIFEYFLALLYGGVVKGKDRLPSGAMGADDFSFASGVSGGKSTKGSAKLYNKAEAIHQSTKGFVVDEPIYYVVGIKQQDESQLAAPAAGTKFQGGGSDVNKIISIAIYFFPVTKTEEGKYKPDGSMITAPKFKSDSKNLTVNASNEVAIHQGVHSGKFVGNVLLCTTPTSSYKDMVESAVGNLEDKVQEAFKHLKDLYGHITTAKTTSKEYISSGDTNKGNEAFNGFINADQSFALLVKSLQADPKKGTGYGQKVSGNKKKAREISESLDSLIESIINKKLLK